MRRFIWLVVSVTCVFALIYMQDIWDVVRGQSLFRLTVNGDMHSDILKLADDGGLDMGAFALTQTQFSGDGEMLIYECLRYHAEAMGVLVTHGSPITSSQIERGESVVMLSHAAALSQFSVLEECIDNHITLEGESFRIVGLYREYEPLNFLTRTAHASAIMPMQKTENPRRLYVWLRSAKASPFLFQQALQKIEQLANGMDAGDMQAYNLENARRMGQQGVRFVLLLLLTMLCKYVLSEMGRSRRRFYGYLQNMFRRYYGVRACLYSIPSFLINFVPSIAVVGGWYAYLIHCAENLVISAEIVPKALLDPESWLTKFNAATITGNNLENMPVFGYVLNARLSPLCWVVGLLALWALWLGLRPKAVKEDIVE